jgi:hypothetical protein
VNREVLNRAPRQPGSPVKDRLELVSHFAGRLRVRASTFRVLPEVGAAVVEHLLGLDGVLDCTTSAVTGSLLVRYDPAKLELPRLVAIIVRTGGLHGLTLVVDGEEPEPPGNRIREVLGGLDRRVRTKARGQLDLRSAIPAALMGTGLTMFLAGRRRVPEWYDLIFWGFVTFCNMNPATSAGAVGAEPQNETRAPKGAPLGVVGAEPQDERSG